jgi:hypothetical protein
MMVERRVIEDAPMLAEGLAGAIPPAVYGTGRICKEPECDVRLSRYNSTEWCAVHESPAAMQRPYDSTARQRGRRRNRSSRRRTQGTAAA